MAENYEEAMPVVKKQNNTLPLYGNKTTMNLNSMILTNVQSSPYFKVDLFQLKTFHEVVDEIFYKVGHLEPWEKNSRKLAGQVGMCAGVRGVGAGGIVSTSFCILFKLFTLKLTRRQVTTMLNHADSPYIRGLGFLYVRYCQPPNTFWDWLEPYVYDTEEIDLKAGGGYTTTIGEMCRMLLTKLDWFGTLVPRIPVHVSKDLQQRVNELEPIGYGNNFEAVEDEYEAYQECGEGGWEEDGGRTEVDINSSHSPHRRSRERDHHRRDRSRECERKHGSVSRDHSRERRRGRSRSRERRRRSRSRERSRSKERRGRSRSREKRRRGRDRSRSREKRRSRERKARSRSRSREGRSKGRSRSRSRERRSRDARKRSRSRERSRRDGSSHEHKSPHKSPRDR